MYQDPVDNKNNDSLPSLPVQTESEIDVLPDSQTTVQHKSDSVTARKSTENFDVIEDQQANRSDSLYVQYDYLGEGSKILSLRNKDWEYADLHTSSSPTSTEVGYPGIKRPFSFEKVDGFLTIFLVCLVCFAIKFRSGFTLFKGNNLSHLLQGRSESHLYSETTTSEMWSNIFLFLQTMFMVSIVMFVFFSDNDKSLGSDILEDSIPIIFLFAGALSLFFFAKYLLYNFIGYAFNCRNAIGNFIHLYVGVIFVLGIFLFIPALFLIYSAQYHVFVLIVALILFVLQRLLIFYHIITFFLQQNVNILFLIVYLCSVEILPYILLYQGLNYIYEQDIISRIL
ncbi:DUF4271 domain-containing protein [Dysgonomonas sp. 520]|uniref:DUF4271 domain-containing protein n=1 Tax=Dysgonomonas sp. 520 TaxID=2302931 RepID=UPI0013D0B05B|nr:DUF4271 domain-containing protein [Dysgonomonas sp. 520]NDW09164.1 DUF4271 domain-containing protein [Dysgonomonas sp. 520]